MIPGERVWRRKRLTAEWFTQGNNLWRLLGGGWNKKPNKQPVSQCEAFILFFLQECCTLYPSPHPSLSPWPLQPYHLGLRWDIASPNLNKFVLPHISFSTALPWPWQLIRAFCNSLTCFFSPTDTTNSICVLHFLLWIYLTAWHMVNDKYKLIKGIYSVRHLRCNF